MAAKKWLKPESEIEKRIREARLEATQTDENIRLNRQGRAFSAATLSPARRDGRRGFSLAMRHDDH
jgi:hypothetical protein